MSYQFSLTGLVARDRYSGLGGPIEDAARRIGDPPPAPDSEDDDGSWWDSLLDSAPDIAKSVREIYGAVKEQNPGISDEEAMRMAQQQAGQGQSQGPFAKYLPWVIIGGGGLLVVLALKR